MKVSFPLFVLSWLIVAFGQPQMSPLLSFLSSTCGFALFWISLFTVKKRFLSGTLWFLFIQLVQLSWLASPTYQGIYIIFVYVGLSIGLGLQFGVLTLFSPQKPPIPLPQCLGIAALWTIMEWSRLHILCGFAWNPVGLAHTGYPIGAQMATIWGIFGFSFWVILVNLLAVNLFFDPSKKTLCTWGGMLSFPYIFGLFHMQYHDIKKSYFSEPLHVALVQTSLLPDQKVYFHQNGAYYVSPYQQWKNIVLYLEQCASKKIDLIVLPEAALPYSAYATVYKHNSVKNIFENIWGTVDLSPVLAEPFIEKKEEEIYVSNAFWAQVIANHYDAEVVVGLDDCDGDHNYNSAFHFIPHKHDSVTRYEKRVLLPLAEYLPFSFLKPFIARYGITQFFTHGKRAKVMKGKCPLSISICYEECFSHLMREGRLMGAKLFVNVTNDAWYPSSRLPQQHFDHGRIRAIENGVPLIRACNTGVTAGIDSLGRTIDTFQSAKGNFEQERGALYLSLNLYVFPTLYTIWGDRFILFLSFCCLPTLMKRRKNFLAENARSALT